MMERTTAPATTTQTGAAARAVELSVVVPTYREAGNVATIVERLHHALDGIGWEVIFVDDDSPDGTADAARRIALADGRVRVIQRFGRRGLSSACIEGMCAASAPVVAVMDGDGQHDETILPTMLDRIRMGADLAVGTRFSDGGGTGTWDRDRIAKSELATRIAERIAPTGLTDPMSGFFAMRADLARAVVPHLSGIGFKILLDIVLAAPDRLAIAEVGYTFRTREVGESKLDYLTALEYLAGLYSRIAGNILPFRLVLFACVGALGLGVQIATFRALRAIGVQSFSEALVLAVLASLSGNFLLNNALTYRDRRLRGARDMALGWMRFATTCAVGCVANVGAAAWLHQWHSGMMSVPVVVGGLCGLVFNFAMADRFTWGRYR